MCVQLHQLKQHIRKEDSNFINEKERRSTNDQTDQRESSTTRDRNEWRYADVSAGFGFGFGCECFFRTFFSPLFLLAMGAIFRSCLLSPVWSMELVSLHEMDTLPSWSYLDFLPFLDLRACRLPAILTELALLNWVNRLFSPLIRYAISFWCVKPGAKSYLSFFATAGPSVASSFRWSYCACLYI